MDINRKMNNKKMNKSTVKVKILKRENNRNEPIKEVKQRSQQKEKLNHDTITG